MYDIHTTSFFNCLHRSNFHGIIFLKRGSKHLGLSRACVQAFTQSLPFGPILKISMICLCPLSTGMRPSCHLWRGLNVLCATLERPRQPFGLLCVFDSDLGRLVVQHPHNFYPSPHLLSSAFHTVSNCSTHWQLLNYLWTSRVAVSL